MKILMRGMACGPDGYMRPDTTHDVARELGRQLVASHEAVPADRASEADCSAAQAEFEAAEAKAADEAEAAALNRPKGRRS
jgi:hypothetical protein